MCVCLSVPHVCLSVPYVCLSVPYVYLSVPYVCVSVPSMCICASHPRRASKRPPEAAYLRVYIKYFFTWLTGMKKLIFYVNNFFGSGHFSDLWYLKKDQKMTGTKNFFASKNQLCHVHQPCKGIFEMCFVFTHFFVRASNGRQYSNFENWCLKMKSWGLYHAYILWKSWLPDDFPKPNLY